MGKHSTKDLSPVQYPVLYLAKCCTPLLQRTCHAYAADYLASLAWQYKSPVAHSMQLTVYQLSIDDSSICNAA